MTMSRGIMRFTLPQVTIDYGHAYLHRPDMALLSYGFVPRRDPPLLSTVDLPSGFGDVRHPREASYPATPTHDPDYGVTARSAP